MEQLSDYPQNLEGARASRTKLLAPEQARRPEVRQIVRVYNPFDSFIVGSPPEEEALFLSDRVGYLTQAMDICTKPAGVFACLEVFGLSVVTYQVVQAEDGSGTIYLYVEDLVHTRRNGFFFGSYDMLSNALLSKENLFTHAAFLDHLYGGLISYVLSTWQTNSPFLWDAVRKKQYYMDLATGQRLLFDLDPYICTPRVSVGCFIQSCMTLLMGAHEDIGNLYGVGKSAFPDASPKFPVVSTSLIEVSRLVNEINQFGQANQGGGFDQKRMDSLRYVASMLTANPALIP